MDSFKNGFINEHVVITPRLLFGTKRIGSSQKLNLLRLGFGKMQKYLAKFIKIQKIIKSIDFIYENQRVLSRTQVLAIHDQY